MNGIVKLTPAPMRLEPPRLDPDLEWELCSALDPHPDVGYCPSPSAAGMTDRVRMALAEYEPLMRPLTLRELQSWLLPLTMAVRNPPEQAAFAAFSEMTFIVLEGYPIAMLSRENQKAALSTFKFFPSVADVVELLNESLSTLRRRRRALQSILDGVARKQAKDRERAEIKRQAGPPPEPLDVMFAKAKAAHRAQDDQEDAPK